MIDESVDPMLASVFTFLFGFLDHAVCDVEAYLVP